MALLLRLFLWLWVLCIANASKVSFSSLRGMDLVVRPQQQQHQKQQQQQKQPELQNFFEVSRPVVRSGLRPCHSMRLLQYSFGNTINLPPVSVAYDPPPKGIDSCGGEWDRIVLRWKATARGRQFDRISAVWLSGVEILRTSTAEPTKTGIVWKVSKDVTKYASLFKTNQTLVVELANVIDSTYTGIFNVTLRVDFYSSSSAAAAATPATAPATTGTVSAAAAAPVTVPADIILPISLPNASNGGYWYQLQGATDVGTASFQLPSNVYRAELEVYVSFHGDDEFWYSNPTNDYVQSNNLSGVPANGPYREVLALLDGETIVAEICPLPVIFTGGINPLMWKPVASIGAFNLPSYTVDVTPFLGSLLDGHVHSFSLRVTNSIRFWLLDANLHLWLDHGKQNVSGGLIQYSAPPAKLQFDSEFTGLNGVLKVKAARTLSYSGFVVSSFGNLTTSSSYQYKFDNTNTFSEDGNVNVVEQSVQSSSEVSVRDSHNNLQSLEQLSSSFPLHLTTSQTAGTNQSMKLAVSISHGLKQQQVAVSDGFNYSNSLDTKQDARGQIVIQGNTVTSGNGELKQSYVFDSSASDECYSRNVQTRNSTVLSDEVSRRCLGDEERR